MNISLYMTNSDREKVDKTLTSELPLQGNLREESNVVRPSITINIDNPTKYNYAYIKEFGRYYFIQEITSIRTGIWRLDLEVDVLMTYKDEIRQQQAVIMKQEGTAYSNELYNDGSFVFREDTFVETHMYQNGFNDQGQFILLTAGAIGG